MRNQMGSAVGIVSWFLASLLSPSVLLFPPAVLLAPVLAPASLVAALVLGSSARALTHDEKADPAAVFGTAPSTPIFADMSGLVNLSLKRSR